MNREGKIARLQALLDRVQTRAKQGRPGPRAAAAPKQDQAWGVAPVAMPTAEPFDVEETRPFAKLPVAVPIAEPVEPAPQIEPAEVEISIGTAEIDFDVDDVGDGGLEIIEPEEQAPASSQRPLSELDDVLDIDLAGGLPEPPRVTPPPESGPQAATKPTERAPELLEVDDTPRGRLSPERPSIEMLGMTVDLPGDDRPDAALELDQKPVSPRLLDRPTGEMEAVIPGSLSPGAYPPSETETASDLFGTEPSTNDWAIPSGFEAKTPQADKPTLEVESDQPPTKKPEEIEQDRVQDRTPIEATPTVADKLPEIPAPVEVQPVEVQVVKEEQPPPELEEGEPEAITKKPSELDLQQLAARDLAEARKAEPAVPQPVRIEIAGKVITAPDMTPTQVAEFAGSFEAAAPKTFLGLLDASLDLGAS